MKKLLCLLIAALLLTSASLAETYTEVAKRYLNTHGQWWNYDQELWLAFVADAKASDTSRSNTGRAIAATVELDADTGEVLGVYPYILEEVGYFFVPHAIWEATPDTAPNG